MRIFIITSLLSCYTLFIQAKDTLVFKGPNKLTYTVVAENGNKTNNKKNGTWTYLYDDGQLGCEGTYHMGIQVGKWTYYKKSYKKNTSDIFFEVHYTNGMRDGVYKEYKYGRLTLEGQYALVKDKQTNKVISTKVEEWHEYKYLQGTKEIYKKYRYDDQQLRDILHYNKGKMIAQSTKLDSNTYYKKYYADSGQLIGEGHYRALRWNSEERYGEWKSYEKDGTLKYTSNYKEGKLHGNYVFYYPNGNPLKSISYVEGKRSGETKVYYENGTLKEVVTYNENGKPFGTQKEYYENGNLKAEGKKTGIFPSKTGLWKTYYEDTLAIKQTTTFNEDGMQSGEERLYYKDGTLAGIRNSVVYNKTENFKVSVYDGQEIKYHKNGVTGEVIEWDMGKVVKGIFYRSDSSLYRTFEYKDEQDFLVMGGKTAKLPRIYNVYYHTNGNIEKEGYTFDDGMYIQDEKDGIWNYYYSDGHLHMKQEYNKGDFVRTIIHLNLDGTPFTEEQEEIEK